MVFGAGIGAARASAKSSGAKAGVSDFVEWDIRNWSAALKFWSRHTRQDFAQCRALEIGGGHGGLSLWLASQGARVTCSDAVVASPLAVSRHAMFGVSHLVEYEVIDAMDIPHVNEFDVIVFKSLLGAVGAERGRDGQAHAVREMYRALRRGGELFFAENLQSSFIHRYCRRHFVEWGKSCRYITVEEMLQFLVQFRSVQYDTVGFAGVFGRNERQRSILGTVDSKMFNRVLPEEWKYVMFGIATK